MMTRSLLAALLAAASLPAAADGARFAPMFGDPEFRFQPTIAALVGALKPEDNPSGVYAGVEFSFNSGIYQTPERRIRSHLTLGAYDESGLKLDTVEFSPRYTVPMGSGFSIGIGPGIAYLRSTLAGQTVSHLAWVIAGGISFRKGAYYAGVDLRYLDTREKQLVNTTREADNWGIAAKVGRNF